MNCRSAARSHDTSPKWRATHYSTFARVNRSLREFWALKRSTAKTGRPPGLNIYLVADILNALQDNPLESGRNLGRPFNATKDAVYRTLYEESLPPFQELLKEDFFHRRIVFYEKLRNQLLILLYMQGRKFEGNFFQ